MFQQLHCSQSVKTSISTSAGCKCFLSSEIYLCKHQKDFFFTFSYLILPYSDKLYKPEIFVGYSVIYLICYFADIYISDKNIIQEDLSISPKSLSKQNPDSDTTLDSGSSSSSSSEKCRR